MSRGDANKSSQRTLQAWGLRGGGAADLGGPVQVLGDDAQGAVEGLDVLGGDLVADKAVDLQDDHVDLGGGLLRRYWPSAPAGET